MKLTGADILIKCLQEQKVDSIFGYPGGAVLNIYDSLYKNRDIITHYLTSHEQGAAHAADGYARATGKVGVCLATSGPGATNLVTGIATAYMDSVPMVAITGNVSANLLGKDSFQEVDISGIVMPITKHSYIVKEVEELADVIREAFNIARTGRPGPVLVDITKDVTSNMCEYEEKTIVFNEPRKVKSKDSSFLLAKELIEKAEKPIIYAGGGVIASDCSRELIDFVELIDAPICTSLMGKGGYPHTGKYYTGMVGMHGTKASNIGVTNCDLLITLGARFSDRVISNVKKFAPNAKILQMDIDPSEVDKNILTEASLVGDLKLSLEKLIKIVEQQDHKEWINFINDIKEKNPLQSSNDEVLKPWHILESINKITGGDAVFATEVGQHQMWAAQYLQTDEPRRFLTSAGLGTMGYGLGASIGAAVARPDKTVFNIAGDGCFRMNHIEIATAVEYELPIIIIVMNNHALGMVRQWQTFFYDKRYASTDLTTKTTDFVALAKAYNAEGFNVTKVSEVEETIKKAIALKKPCVINFEIHNDDKVFPMVSPGAGIDELITQ